MTRALILVIFLSVSAGAAVNAPPRVDFLTPQTSGTIYQVTADPITFTGVSLDTEWLSITTWELTGATVASGTAIGGNGGFNGWNFTTPNLSFGLTTVSVTSTDVSGYSRTRSMNISVGSWPAPTVDFTLPTSGAPYVADSHIVTFSGFATDDIPITRVDCEMTGATTASWVASIGANPWSFSKIMSVGTTMVQFTVLDAAGRTASSAILSVTVPAGLPPLVMIAPPPFTSGGEVYGSDPLPVIVSDPIIAEFRFTVPITGFAADDVIITGASKGELREITPGLVYELDVITDHDGLVEITLPADSVVDQWGNGNVAGSTSVLFDSQLPSLTVSITVHGTVSEDIVRLDINGTKVTPVDGEWSATIDVPAGSTAVEIRAEDKDGGVLVRELRLDSSGGG